MSFSISLNEEVRDGLLKFINDVTQRSRLFCELDNDLCDHSNPCDKPHYIPFRKEASRTKHCAID